MVRVFFAVGFAGVQRFVPGFGFADGGDQRGVFAGDQRVFLRRFEQQAVIGLGKFALHRQADLVSLVPAEQRQQRGDEFFFELGFVAGGEFGGLEMRAQPVGQRAGAGGWLGGQFGGFLRDEAVVEQRVVQPVLREEVVVHGVCERRSGAAGGRAAALGGQVS